MEVVRIKKILAQNWPIGICLHCVRRSSWIVPTTSTLLYVLPLKFKKSIAALDFFMHLKNIWKKETKFKLPILVFSFWGLTTPLQGKQSSKGQLISKCLLTISTLAHNLGARAEIVKFFRWYFGQNDDTQKTFWN